MICVQHTRDFLLCRCLLDLTLLGPSRNQTVTEWVVTTVCACACPLVHVPLCVHKPPDQVSNRHMTSRLTMHVFTRPQHNLLNGDRFKAAVVVLSSSLCVLLLLVLLLLLLLLELELLVLLLLFHKALAN